MAQLAPPATGGAVRLDYLLQRLSEPRRVMVIAAHPDDEDTGLLSLLARGLGADVAYLSLSRGEGGQNLIGDELGIDLGLLRTRELEAARSIDGARQFFTRAYDFGFSRSIAETSRLWTPDSILKDVVRVVRRFRPHVVVSVFAGTEGDGHGQHQMAGVLAGRAFEVAGDAAAFPELDREEGLEPWTPVKFYRSARFNRAAETLRLSTGMLDPRVGRTFSQIAMESRSQHRSQDMGRLQPTGPDWTRLSLERDRTGRAAAEGEVGLFDGIPGGGSWLTRLADSLRRDISPVRTTEAATALADALVRARAEGLEAESVETLEDALAVAAGLVIDGRSDGANLVPGQRIGVTVELYNAGPYETRLRAVSLSVPAGWSVAPAVINDVLVQPGELITAEFRVELPENAALSQPYFLRGRMAGALYDWTAVVPETLGDPFGPAIVRARVDMTILGAEVALERDVSYRYNDQAVGEIRRALAVVPAVEVRLSPTRLVWPAEGADSTVFEVMLAHNAPDETAGQVTLQVDGWRAPPGRPFRLTEVGESQSFRIALARPPGVQQTDVTVRAIATADDGRTFGYGNARIEYGHIHPVSRVVEAAATVSVTPIRLPAVASVGYVRGAADRVPEALAQVGVPLHMLDAAALETTDLTGFDAIVVGSRAYEVDQALVDNNERLLDYVRQGGTLIVQYQQYQFVSGGYAPYPLEISRPHDRITDENAPVKLLRPEHPVFNLPNRIDRGDWEGWPQERGLYFAGVWDAAYEPLLEMKDPDSDPIRGGLLVADYGEGVYVYTGISFFRALPAGVVGAYKLFLNLLALAGDGMR